MAPLDAEKMRPHAASIDSDAVRGSRAALRCCCCGARSGGARRSSSSRARCDRRRRRPQGGRPARPRARAEEGVQPAVVPLPQRVALGARAGVRWGWASRCCSISRRGRRRWGQRARRCRGRAPVDVLVAVPYRESAPARPEALANLLGELGAARRPAARLARLTERAAAGGVRARRRLPAQAHHRRALPAHRALPAAGAPVRAVARRRRPSRRPRPRHAPARRDARARRRRARDRARGLRHDRVPPLALWARRLLGIRRHARPQGLCVL